MFRALLEKIKQGLARTRSMFAGLVDLFRFKGRVDQNFLDELEARLLRADVGLAATTIVVDRVRQAYKDREVEGEMADFVKAQLRDLLSSPSQGITFQPGLTVVMVAGVNGSGKTTSIAKLTRRLMNEGKTVMVAAGDTFRAAAVEQLAIWGERLGCEVVRKEHGSDPAAVAHEACERAKSRGVDVLIVDTAGRLHTQTHLMRELEKVRRVMSKLLPGAPHETLLVLDATTGQNAVTQAEMFCKSVACTGVILSKLDGTAKGGAIFSIKQKLNLPVKYVGVGEALDDLELFDPDAYVAALFE